MSIVFEQGVREVIRMEGTLPDVMEEVLHCQSSGKGINEGGGDRVNAVKDVIGGSGVGCGVGCGGGLPPVLRSTVWNQNAAAVPVLTFKALILRSLRQAKKTVGREDLDNIGFRGNHTFILEDVEGVRRNLCGIHDFHQSTQRQPATETLHRFR